ncbi:MAG: Rrf2 family transcriptional regulator [Planctomycetes bacterium]|nr:Rrf2 family transcriptional regulator [Planctomycetota bacterium]
MRYSKSTRYALYAALEMAAASGPVTVAQVAALHRLPETALAKVMQALVRAGIARGVRGVGGGYVLARSAGEISTLDVIAAFDPPRREGDCLLDDGGGGECRGHLDCRLRRLFDEVDEQLRCTFASVSLETLVRGARARQ